MKKTFWITNGIDSSDEYRVIGKVSHEIRCMHCSNKKESGFEYVGKTRMGFIYQICSSCLYNPATNMVNNLFIAVGKNKNPERFNELLKDCENKDAYLKIQEHECIYCNTVLPIGQELQVCKKCQNSDLEYEDKQKIIQENITKKQAASQDYKEGKIDLSTYGLIVNSIYHSEVKANIVY